MDETGLYHVFLTTRLKKENKGCLAHLVSENMEQFREEEPIYINEDYKEPECPDYFLKNGFYYLLYTLPGSIRYRYSKKPFSEMKEVEADLKDIINVPKCAVFNNKIVFVGFESGMAEYASQMRFVVADVNENGELVFHNNK